MEIYDGIIGKLALALGAGWCAGINLYATIAVLGLMARYVPGFVLPPEMEILASGWVVIPALSMYCIEFVADKVPAVDSAWDTVHTFIRIPAGAALAAAALGDVPAEVQMGAALLGGTLALGSHTAKATTRVAAHGTGVSPIVSPAASLVEDGLVIATVGLLAANPLLAMGLTFLMMIGAALLVYFLWSITRRVLRSLGTGTSGNEQVPPPPPAIPA
jgi:hypothetical protein